MKAAKTSKNLKEILYPTHQKLLKRKWNNITPAKTNVPIFSQAFSEVIKLIIQTYQMRNQKT